MKKIGEYTCRGQVASEITERIPLFDGRFDTGWRVTEFIVAAEVMTLSDDCFGTLFTDKQGSGNMNWDWQRNEQIAWSGTTGQSNSVSTPFTLVDPDNLFIEDLFIRCKENGGSNCHYFIKMEKYEFSAWKGALAMVRNNSQAVT